VSEALDLLRALAEEAENDPSAWMEWLPPQDAFHRDPKPVKLLRTGNQLGKTTAGLTEVHWRSIGTHPHYETREPPIEAWVICASWSQSLAIQAKFYEIARKHLIAGTRFDAVNGFHANRPTARYPNGSIVRFKTTQQNSLDLAGATIDLAMFDEPPKSPRIFEEVRKRLLRRQGTLLMCLTPINAPCGWLRELCEAGQITDHHWRLEAESLIPVGDTEPLRLPDGTPMDEAWIDEVRRNTLPQEIPVVVDGEWEMRVEGRVFSQFDATTMVHDNAPDGEVTVCLGIDHGTKVGKEVAVLVLVDRSEDQDRIVVWDQYVGRENTSTSDDARGILDMLKRNKLRWSQLDEVWGDRLYIRGIADKKSNRDLIDAVARLLGVPSQSLSPSVRTVKRGRGRGKGSVDAGCRYLHQAMVKDGHFSVHPRCEDVIEALQKWDYRDDDNKDKIDALRYALQRQVFAPRRGKRQKRRLYLY
tara:strand:+ start:1955 stop:3373 length:1419 start_codon:yes stop_codon:yes gene_type:complete